MPSSHQHSLFIVPCSVLAVPFAVSAPTGRRNVATGGAARPHGGPTRNPWKADEGKGVEVLFFFFRPGGAKEIFWADETSANAPRPQLPPHPRPRARGGGRGEMGHAAARPAIPPPLQGGCVKTRTLHGLRDAESGVAPPGAYNPPPRWGENGSSKFQSLPARPKGGFQVQSSRFKVQS